MMIMIPRHALTLAAGVITTTSTCICPDTSSPMQMTLMESDPPFQSTNIDFLTHLGSLLRPTTI